MDGGLNDVSVHSPDVTDVQIHISSPEEAETSFSHHQDTSQVSTGSPDSGQRSLGLDYTNGCTKDKVVSSVTCMEKDTLSVPCRSSRKSDCAVSQSKVRNTAELIKPDKHQDVVQHPVTESDTLVWDDWDDYSETYDVY